MFTDAEKVQIRKFCGYPLMGGTASPNWGWRYFTAYGLMEFRLTNLSSDEETEVRTNFLAVLPGMESAIDGTGANLDTDQAAVWTHNKHEQRDREALYNAKRRRLCAFLGVPPGPGLGAGGLRLVV